MDRYVALRRIKLAGGRYCEAGQEIPEAANWKPLRALVDGGWIKVIPGLPEKKAAPAPKAEPAPEPEKAPEPKAEAKAEDSKEDKPEGMFKELRKKRAKKVRKKKDDE